MTIEHIQYMVLFLCTLIIISFYAYFKNPIFEINFDFRDIIVFIGILLIGIGAYMIYQPSAFIVTGSLLFWLGRPR